MLTPTRKAVCALLTLTAILWPLSSYSWGLMGHEVVAEVGARLAEKGSAFWRANQANLSHLATVPDDYWKKVRYQEERSNHWFEPDGYYSSISDFGKISMSYTKLVKKYGEEKVIGNGTAPWRIRQLMLMSIDALTKYNYKKALQMAGTMAHYVGDLSQPLHVTTNYDGKESNQSGVHKYFETTVVQSIGKDEAVEKVARVAGQLLNDQKFLNQFSGALEDSLMNEIKRSYRKKDDVLRADKAADRSNDKGTAELRNLAIERMADGAATLAIILNIIWEQGGDSAYNSRLTVPDPNWVEPGFDDTEANSSFVPLDDCG